MIILDFSSVIIANLHAQIGIQNVKEVNEDLLRHMVLNTIRSINVKFKKDGPLVIACDRGTWRKNAFPYYKANRKKAKDASGLDWRAIFEAFTKIRTEIKECFPYRVIEVEEAEADDVIAALVFKYGEDLPMLAKEEILIMSPDKDFAQLHRYENVKQFDPIRKKWITQPSADDYLLEHIIRGDSGDGVPNILSDDDTFVVPEKRQKPMTQKKLAEAKEWFRFTNPLGAPPEIGNNWIRNRRLIDLRQAPSSIHEQVLVEYENQAGKGRSMIFDYMMRHRLRNLIESIGDF